MMTNEKQFLKLIFLFLLLNIYFQSISFSFAQTESLDNVDFIGIERRLQTNVMDFNSFPAKQQLEMDIVKS